MRQSPAVVSRTQADSNGLALLETVDIGIGFLFSITQGRDIAVLPIELVQPSGRVAAPGCKSLFRQAFTASLIGGLYIHLKTLGYRIRKGWNSMVAVHPPGVAGDLRESRHPSITHLFRHSQERSQDVLLNRLVHQSTQRMCCPVGVPDPVVSVERSTFVFMDVIVVCTPIPAILTEAYRPFKSPVIGCVKHPLPFLVTLHPDPPEGLVPNLATFRRQGIHIVTADLPAQVCLRLCDINERNTVAQPDRRVLESQDHPVVSPVTCSVHGNRHGLRFHEHIYFGLILHGLPSFHGLPVPGYLPSPAGQDNLERIFTLQ